jgi:dihydrofolate reductase
VPKVIADITMSLDGYVTGSGADEQHGLGDAPELHTWVTDQDAVDTEILERATAQSGAVVMGRRLFDIVDGPGGWNEEMGYGADQSGTPPFFVVTHAPPQDVRLERELGMRFTRRSLRSIWATPWPTSPNWLPHDPALPSAHSLTPGLTRP